MSDVFDRIAARAAGTTAARLTERRDVWSAEPRYGGPGFGGAVGSRRPAPGAHPGGGGRPPTAQDGRVGAAGPRPLRPGVDGWATRSGGQGARADGTAVGLRGAAPSASLGPVPRPASEEVAPGTASAEPARGRRVDPRRRPGNLDGGTSAEPGGMRPAAAARGLVPAGAAAPTDGAPNGETMSAAVPRSAPPSGVPGTTAARRLRGRGPAGPPGDVGDAGGRDGTALAPRRGGPGRAPRDQPSPVVGPDDLLRDHVAPALAGRGVLDLAAGDEPAAPGLGPVDVPEGAVVHVHVERVDVHRPAPDPPRAAGTVARVDHADYLARQQRRWR